MSKTYTLYRNTQSRYVKTGTLEDVLQTVLAEFGDRLRYTKPKKGDLFLTSKGKVDRASIDWGHSCRYVIKPKSKCKACVDCANFEPAPTDD